MEVVSLDKFKTEQKVELEGSTYTVRGLTVAEYIDGSVIDEMENAQSAREYAKLLVDALEKLTDISREKLERQQLSVLSALMRLSQGMAPEEEPENSKKSKS